MLVWTVREVRSVSENSHFDLGRQLIDMEPSLGKTAASAVVGGAGSAFLASAGLSATGAAGMHRTSRQATPASNTATMAAGAAHRTQMYR